MGAIRAALDAGGVHDAEIQSFGTNRDFTIRAQDVGQSAARDAEAQAPSAEQVAARIDTLLTQQVRRRGVSRSCGPKRSARASAASCGAAR